MLGYSGGFTVNGIMKGYGSEKRLTKVWRQVGLDLDKTKCSLVQRCTVVIMPRPGNV